MISFKKIILTFYLVCNFVTLLAENEVKEINKEVNVYKILDQNLKKDLSTTSLKDTIDGLLNNENKNKLILRPYIDFGYRIVLWASHGLMNIVNPFKDNKIPEINDFNFNTDSISNAICLKEDNELNKYCFAQNYGIKVDLNGIEKDNDGNTKHINEIYENIKFLHENRNQGIDSGVGDNNIFISNILKKKDINVVKIIDYFTKITGSEEFKNVYKNMQRIGIISTLYTNIKEAVKLLNKNSSLSLIKNKDQKLSQYYLVNIVKLFFIKNSLDTYVNEYTAKCFNEYSKSKNINIDDLIKKIDSFSTDPIITKLKDIFKELDIPEDDSGKDSDKKTIIDIKKEIDSKLKVLKKDDEITLGSFIYLVENEFPFEDASKLCSSIKILMDEFKKSKNSEEKKKDLIDIKKKLVEYKLLDEDYIKEKAKFSEEGEEKIIQKCMAQLSSRLKKLRHYERNKNKLKQLKKENFEWLHPFNYRFGLNLTHYFNKKIGINFDVSLSYSTLGFKKSFFLSLPFIDQMFFYLIKMHEPILSGRLFNSQKDNITLKDVIYGGTNLDIADLLIENLFKGLGTPSTLFGNERYKDSFALNEYINVMNQYTDSEYILVDCLVRLTQINFCLKTGVVFNLNNLFIKNNNIKESKVYNELIINTGLYFNFQRLKINVTLSNDSDIPKCGKDELYKPTTTAGLLYKALNDILINLNIANGFDNDDVYRAKCAKMLYNIINNLYPYDIVPQNNNILGYVNTVTNENLDERSAFGVFNTFKVRPLVEIVYRLTMFGYSLSVGCEFIFIGPLNSGFYNKDPNFNSDNSDSSKKFKLPFDFEILPHLSFSKCFNLL